MVSELERLGGNLSRGRIDVLARDIMEAWRKEDLKVFERLVKGKTMGFVTYRRCCPDMKSGDDSAWAYFTLLWSSDLGAWERLPFDAIRREELSRMS